MATTAKRLFGPAQLTNTTATKYTVPASTKAIIRHVHFSNTTAAARAVTASIGADAAGTRLFDAYSIPAGQTLDWYGYIVMDAAEVLAAHCDVTSIVTMTVFGDELTLG